VSSARAHAKLNLTLVVGPRRPDGKHEVATVLQRLALADTIELEPAGELGVEGFPEDTHVRGALEALAERAGVQPHWHARITKEIPVAAGLGGGSSDAAIALLLANATLEQPLPPDELAQLAATLGADVPFFLADGPQLGTGDGSTLEALQLPQEFLVLLVLPDGERKPSTRAVYEDFDEINGIIDGFMGDAEHDFADEGHDVRRGATAGRRQQRLQRHALDPILVLAALAFPEVGAVGRALVIAHRNRG